MSAGVGTTATLLTWTLYFLARNPEVFEKLRTLVLSRFGSTPHSITLKGPEFCEYLHLVTRETLRLAALVPTLSRSSLVDTTLPRGGGEDGTQPVFVQREWRPGLPFSQSIVVVINAALMPRNSTRKDGSEDRQASNSLLLGQVVGSVLAVSFAENFFHPR